MCEKIGEWAIEQGLQGFSIKNSDPKKVLLLEREEEKRKKRETL